MLRRAFLAPMLLVALPAMAEVPLQQEVEAVLATAPAGTRFGLLVVDDQGREVVAINADQRFIPASNTKLFTTAAAYASLPAMDAADTTGGTSVALGKGRRGRLDVVLRGRGDARMSSASDCTEDCLATLADAIAAKTRRVGDVIGDDTFFPDQRWSPGMSWNNIWSNDGTAPSALTLDSNEQRVEVTPTTPGQLAQVSLSPYFTLVNDVITVAEGETRVMVDHAPNSRVMRLYGQIAAGAEAWHERLGIDDPAHYAAWTLREMLIARGVRVKGEALARHRQVSLIDEPGKATLPPATGKQPDVLASLVPPPLGADVVTINKVSQNLHAELLLRRIGSLRGYGSLADGLAAERAVFEAAGIPRAGYDFSDGSGMSTYNRVSPRAAVALLRWAGKQPWGEAWRASLPVGGTDGTLQKRFKGTLLEGRLWAKTGTLNATNALSGHFRAASGREFTFSFFANDVPDGAKAVPTMDAALVRIAARN